MRILLVIDMLNDFVSEEGKLFIGPQTKECIAETKKQINDFRSSEDPVIYLNDNHPKNDIEFDLFPPHCIEGSHGEMVLDELEPQEGDLVFNKQTYSAMVDNPDLCEFLLERGGVVYIAGVCTSICVMETVADLYKASISCKIIEKACCDLDEESHNMAINRMKLLFGTEIIWRKDEITSKS